MATTKTATTKSKTVDPVDDVEAAPVRRPRPGEHVTVAVHPDAHNAGRGDTAPAVVTRVLEDDDGQVTVDVHAYTRPPRDLDGVAWYPDAAAYEQAEEAHFDRLPGHRRDTQGRIREPGENHITQAPWRREDVRLWPSALGAWPLDAGGE